MRQVRWFDRQFSFPQDPNIFPAVLERLSGTPVRLRHKCLSIPSSRLTIKPEAGWSIAEHLGHLSDLEPLWQGRITDILTGQRYMREADLSNQTTEEADHNATKLEELLHRFELLRTATLNQLLPLTETQITQSALHPRLNTPMRIMDLCLFVAEHDDHHLAAMSRISQGI
ncbi:MAG: DinB family protein [Bacteroidota bacterium]